MLLYHDDRHHGQIAMGSKMLGGAYIPERQYNHVGHFVDVPPGNYWHDHDVTELHSLGYRSATHAEHAKYAKLLREKHKLEE